MTRIAPSSKTRGMAGLPTVSTVCETQDFTFYLHAHKSEFNYFVQILSEMDSAPLSEADIVEIRAQFALFFLEHVIPEKGQFKSP